MIDKEILIDLLTRNNQRFEIKTDNYYNNIGAESYLVVQNTYDQGIKEAIGYSDFVSYWLFNKDGKLINIGHYE